MGIMTQKYTIGYNRDNIDREFITYQNTGSDIEYIKSITCGFGVAGEGIRYTWNDDVTGTGNSIYVKLYSDSYEASQWVDTSIGRQSGSEGYYPIFEDCPKITFNFVDPIPVNPQSTVTIYIQANTKSEYNSVLILGKVGDAYTDLTLSKIKQNLINIHTSNKWEKGHVFIYVDGWQLASLQTYNNNSWK